MRPLNRHYEITPQIVRADQKTRITIRPRFDHGRFDSDTEYKITHVATEQLTGPSGQAVTESWKQKPVDGAIAFERVFPDEQEHSLVIENEKANRRAPDLDFRVYSVRPDLFGRRPWKGDMHLHTHYSDGVQSPAYVAAAGRSIGFDFMAITDHRAYAPSLEAIRTFQPLATDLTLLPGEEVHPPGNPVHIVSFAADHGIQETLGDEANHRRQVADAMAALPELPPGADPFICASTEWCYDCIRQAGGLAIFPHPYWKFGRRFLPEPVIRYLFDRRSFDAFEVLGGAIHIERATNYLQTARYAEEMGRGPRVPVVGSSDTHNTDGELFGWYYTIAFAPSPSKADLFDAIRNHWTIAIDNPTGEEVLRAVGPFRLVKYAMFLAREILPHHDTLCAQEGQAMTAHLQGNRSAAEALARMQGGVGKLYRNLWDE